MVVGIVVAVVLGAVVVGLIVVEVVVEVWVAVDVDMDLLQDTEDREVTRRQASAARITRFFMRSSYKLFFAIRPSLQTGRLGHLTHYLNFPMYTWVLSTFENYYICNDLRNCLTVYHWFLDLSTD